MSAADAAWYDFQAAQYLLDAGRALTAAGDSARAITVYERIIEDYPGTDDAIGAQVRLHELRPAG